jgi:predicted RNase H-like nuclease (RuvC/YqgF family)
MGNQIKFSKKNKDEPFTGNEEDYLALEIKSIQLKNTNRKLISKLDLQKKLIKTLTSELDAIQNSKLFKSHDELKNDYSQLKIEYDKLDLMFKDSRAEIAKLKGDVNDLDKEKDVNDDVTVSRWNKLKNRLPDDIKNLRDSKNNDEKNHGE